MFQNNINIRLFIYKIADISKVCFFILIVFFISACSSSVRFSSSNFKEKSSTSYNNSNQNQEPIVPGSKIIGKASFYGDEFHGRKTSNGEIYDKNKLSAAHKTMPFGTLLKVRNIKNNREVIVRINDRGPFVDGRIIDLSYKAASELDMIRDGVIDVEITILE